MKIVITILVVMLLVLQYRLWIGHGSLTHVHHLEQARQHQVDENHDLQERNQALAAEVYDLKNGYDAIEERARTEMGMIQQDETFYHVIHGEEHTPVVEGQNSE